jgi:hypothetical protein
LEDKEKSMRIPESGETVGQKKGPFPSGGAFSGEKNVMPMQQLNLHPSLPSPSGIFHPTRRRRD